MYVFSDNDKDKTLVIRITFYNDDVELVNPLGNKTSIHKMSAFYYCINNIGRIGTVQNIFWWGLCYSNDVYKYGFSKILRPFVEEMKKLEKGVDITIHGQKLKLMFIIAGVTGDTLAMHSLFEIKSSASNYFCRLCWLTKKEFKSNPSATCNLRTKENYDIIVKEPENLRVSKGILGSTILHELKFHITDNFILDVMHDCFEGTSGLLIKMTLKYLFEKKVITESEINERLNNFDYGDQVKTDKPTPNITKTKMMDDGDSKIQQRAMQTWLLVRALPFIVSDKLNVLLTKDQRMVSNIKHVIELHLEILCIIMSFEVTNQDILHLHNITNEHNKLFFEIFPNAPRMHKFHHMTHMSDCIKKSGPLRYWWTARFEAAHMEMKKKIHSSPNFKNIPKMLAEQHAFTFSYNQTYKSTITPTYIIHTEIKPQNFLSRNITSISCSHVTYFNVEFSINMMVLVGFLDKLPVFGEIRSMEIVKENLLLHLHIYETLGYDSEFCGYLVDHRANSYKDVWFESLLEKTTFYKWSPIGSLATLIPLRENLSSEIKKYK